MALFYHPRDMVPSREFLLLLNHINKRLNKSISLDALARRTGQSRFQLHREFQRTAGETLKQYTLRLQLERAAAQLAANDDEVLAIAIANGFSSHEVFTRAFRRYFGTSPSRYRIDALANASKPQRLRHLALTKSIGPCVRFFHQPQYKNFGPRNTIAMPVLSISRKEVQPQHILFIRRRIAPSQLQKTLGECLGKLFSYSAKMGLPIAGMPMCRYASTGMGLWTIEPAVLLAAPATGEGEIQPDTLYSGPVALGIHGGSYEYLPDTNAAVEAWIEANDYRVGGAPWEVYVTDPAEKPEIVDWRTEVYWPLEK